jgi:hypothetical protein
MHDVRLPLTGSLIWSQVPKKSPREYVLKLGEVVVARLCWQKGWGSLAVGESPSGSWSLKRVGFLSTRVSVRQTGSEVEEGNFYPNMLGGGRVELSDGRSWRLQSRGFLNPVYDLSDGSGHVAISLEIQGWGSSGKLQFGPARPDDRTTWLLSVLIWHVTVLASEDASSVAAITAVVAAIA